MRNPAPTRGCDRDDRNRAAQNFRLTISLGSVAASRNGRALASACASQLTKAHPVALTVTRDRPNEPALIIGVGRMDVRMVEVLKRDDTVACRGPTHSSRVPGFLCATSSSPDNIDHIQSSWLTPGIKVCQVGLQFGADDEGR